MKTKILKVQIPDDFNDTDKRLFIGVAEISGGGVWVGCLDHEVIRKEDIIKEFVSYLDDKVQIFVPSWCIDNYIGKKCDYCGCEPSVIYITHKGRLCEKCNAIG